MPLGLLYSHPRQPWAVRDRLSKTGVKSIFKKLLRYWYIEESTHNAV